MLVVENDQQQSHAVNLVFVVTPVHHVDRFVVPALVAALWRLPLLGFQNVSFYLQSAIQMEGICRIGQMVFPSLLLPGPSASHFCAYSSAPSQTKPSKKKKKKKSTNLKINRFAHLLNSSIIRRLGVNAVLSHAAGLSAFRSCHSTEFVMVSSGRMPIFVRLPRFQTCWLWPRLFVCMFSASSVIKMCQSHVRQPAPKTGPGIPSYSHECLSNLCLPTFGFHGEKKKKGAGNDHLHLCQPVKSNPRRQNERCQAPTWWAILRTHAKVCQELISPPVLQRRRGVPSCFLLTLADERGRSTPRSPPQK